MKTLSWVLLLLLSFDAAAVTVNPYLSGSWNNTAQSGHGLSIEVISEDVSVVYWYVYHPDGSPTFIIAVGENKGNVIEADAYYNSGMIFGEFDPADHVEIPWGDIKITFQSCTSATMEYSSDLSYEGVPYGSGTIPLTRLLSIDQMQCASNPNAGLYQGTFHSDVTDKDNVGFAIIAPNGDFAITDYQTMVGLGSTTIKGARINGGGTAVSADPQHPFDEALKISGTIDPEYRMVAGYDVDDEDDGYFDLYSVPSLYRRGISLEDIAGSYDLGNLVSQESGSATILSNGEFTGSDSDGCDYSGTLTVPDEQFNLLQVTFKVTDCGVSNGTYKGYGAQIDYFSVGDRRIIRLISSDGDEAGLIDLSD